MPHDQNKSEAPIGSIGQKMKTADTTTTSRSFNAQTIFAERMKQIEDSI